VPLPDLGASRQLGCQGSRPDKSGNGHTKLKRTKTDPTTVQRHGEPAARPVSALLKLLVEDPPAPSGRAQHRQEMNDWAPSKYHRRTWSVASRNRMSAVTDVTPGQQRLEPRSEGKGRPPGLWPPKVMVKPNRGDADENKPISLFKSGSIQCCRFSPVPSAG